MRGLRELHAPSMSPLAVASITHLEVFAVSSAFTVLLHTMLYAGVCDIGWSILVADHKKPGHSHSLRYVMSVSDCSL